MRIAKTIGLTAVGTLTSPQGMILIALLAATIPRMAWASMLWIAGHVVNLEARREQARG